MFKHQLRNLYDHTGVSGYCVCGAFSYGPTTEMTALYDAFTSHLEGLQKHSRALADALSDAMNAVMEDDGGF